MKKILGLTKILLGQKHCRTKILKLSGRTVLVFEPQHPTYVYEFIMFLSLISITKKNYLSKCNFFFDTSKCNFFFEKVNAI